MRLDTCFFFFQAEDGIRDYKVTGVQTCLFRSGDGDVVGKGALAELSQVDPDDPVLGDIELLCDAGRRIQLVAVPLAVVKRERIQWRKALCLCDGKARRAVQASAGEDDGGRHLDDLIRYGATASSARCRLERFSATCSRTGCIAASRGPGSALRSSGSG